MTLVGLWVLKETINSIRGIGERKICVIESTIVIRSENSSMGDIRIKRKFRIELHAIVIKFHLPKECNHIFELVYLLPCKRYNYDV